MTQPELRVVADDLRTTARDLYTVASGFYNDGGGPALKAVTSADTQLDCARACGEVGDDFQAYAHTLGAGVSQHSRKLDDAAFHYYQGDVAAADAIEFDPPEPSEVEIGDDPGEPGYDPVNEYEEALQDAGLLDGASSGMYRQWLQNAADNGVPPETIVEIARQEQITPQSFDVLEGLGKPIVDDNNTPGDPTDDREYFLLPADVTAEQAKQAALMTYIYNAGTGYAEGNSDNDFAETPYSAAEVQRIRDRQEANSWSYELLERADGTFTTTPNGIIMGVGGGELQQLISQRGGTAVGDVYALNVDDYPQGTRAALIHIIESGNMQHDSDHDQELESTVDLDRVLHHEERHSQQWAERGFSEFLYEYAISYGWGNEGEAFETNAGANDGGY